MSKTTHPNEQERNARRPHAKRHTGQELDPKQIEPPSVEEPRVRAESLELVLLTEEADGDHAPKAAEAWNEVSGLE